MPVHTALLIGALTGCTGKDPCTADDLQPLEEKYSTAIAEACADVELADCPAYEALSLEFAEEQDRVCR